MEIKATARSWWRWGDGSRARERELALVRLRERRPAGRLPPNRGAAVNQVNVWAVLVAAVSCFMLGGLWYSPALFGTIWQRESGDTRKPGERHPVQVFGLSLVFALIAALVYALLIPPAGSALQAIGQGLAVGAGLVAASFGINYQFANRSHTLLLVDGGYHAAQFAIYGLVIGLWR
jgi:hypothetical protein